MTKLDKSVDGWIMTNKKDEQGTIKSEGSINLYASHKLGDMNNEHFISNYQPATSFTFLP